MRYKVDLSRWQDLFHSWIRHERTHNEAFDKRFVEDELTYNDTRDMMVNLLWNECHKKSKYKYETWDVDNEVQKWFRHYYPYPGVTKEGVDRDPESIQLSDILYRLEERMSEYVRKNALHTHWGIYELYHETREVFILEMFGDWRAREWCKNEGVAYVP